MATSFTVNKADLEYILKQIKIAEATSIGYTNAPVSTVQAIMDAYGVTAANAAQLPAGLRTVDGTDNNLMVPATGVPGTPGYNPGTSEYGAADTLFPRLTDPVFRNDTDGDSIVLGPSAPLVQGNYGQSGNVVDADPRIITNLIVDMSVNNPAAVDAYFNNPLSLEQFAADHPGMIPLRPGDAMVPNGLYITDADLQSIPNQSPDIGLSPGFNSWMTFFGQFFDHGLDLVTKANNGTVYIPLQHDDPLYDKGADGIAGTADDGHANFMALTRAAPTVVNGVPQHANTTTAFVDQNQTYTSHASHQVFLREYAKVDTDGAGGKGPVAVATGRLLDGSAASGSTARAIGNWAEVKAQAKEMLGLVLSDIDVLDVPLLKTDQYGKFIPGANGYAQVAVSVTETVGSTVTTTYHFIEGTAAGLDLHALPLPASFTQTPGSTVTVSIIGTGHAFLDDIAHSAAPKGMIDHDRNPNTPMIAQLADSDDVAGNAITPNEFGVNETYDNELLDAHFITGDGRGNENIALTAVHSIFHSEHNRLVEVNKETILQSNDLAFLNEWLLVDVAAVPTSAADIANLVWDGERLFQAARFGTEMQYQHLVFEEFARRIQPMVDPFIFNTSPNVDPSIVAEFAHTVYRFGHSMLTGTVDRIENDLTTVNGDASQKTLLAVFLNPQAYLDSGADLEEINANLIRGLTRDVGNEIDEFIVSNVRNSLLGLPLDLGALNIARARDTGIPSLNETRAQLYDGTGLADLKPYASWVDFAQHIKHPTSIVNFIAAYGTHVSITSATTMAEKREAATLLVLGDGDNADGVTIRGVTYTDRLDFLNGRGAYGQTVNPANPKDLGGLGGLNDVDLWIGGLAEELNEFGGMLGSTFNYVFEYQMEKLQFGDRLYYLTRTQGLNFLNNLEPNTFSDLVMRNTDLGGLHSTHLNGALFTTPDMILELDGLVAQEDYNPDDPASKDPVHEDEFLQAIDPKVVRTQGVQRMNGATPVLDEEGKPIYDGGVLKFSGGEHVVLGGTEGNDTLLGDKGIDTLWGDGGDDYLNGGMESDDVFGGEGDDVIEDPFGDDVLRGNQGNDVITSARGADLLFGDQGTDYIVLGQDAGEVFGGTGADFILGGDGKDFLLGNEGDDWIEGGAGFDTIAGENSELFFNSPIIGHDVLFGQGDETDYDSESGDDIMTSGPSVFRYEGMFGFDWGIGKMDIAGVHFDLQIPIFTTIPNDILRDRFDQVEALSGWKYDDVLDGDDRGHSGGSSSPDSTPVELFTDHFLDQAGVNRIAGLRQLIFGQNAPAVADSHDVAFTNGNILIGGGGNDMIRGRGGFDIIDGDSWLNVRIKIVIPSGPNAGTYSAESMNTDKTVAGEHAGLVFHTNADGSPDFARPAFEGRSLTSLLLDRTINPGDMSIVREILDGDPNNSSVDTAVFQGGDLEYEIEGTRIIYDANTGEALRRVNLTGPENAPLNIRDENGDGFITVRDLDDGTVAAPGRVGGLTVSRGALTDDTDKLVNIERLQFADKTLTVGQNTTNNLATGTVIISDPSPFDHDGNPATAGVVSPIVGQVLTAKLSNLVDLDGVPLDANGNPVGLTFEWQTTEAGNDGGWATISTGLTYTVRPVDPAHVLRAVAVFKDSKGVTERIASQQTDNVTAPFFVNENSPTGTVVASTIPFSLDYDPLGFGGTGVTDGDVVQLTHVISPNQDAGGRFTIVNVGDAAAPIYQLQVANGGPQMLNYEAGVHTPANQSHQFVDNQYQIVIDTYTDTIANGGVLMASRQFTIILNDVTGEIVDIAPTVDLNADRTTTTTTSFNENFNNSSSYTQDDGSWTQDWVEQDDDGSSISDNGQIRINNNRLEFDNGSNAANSNGASISRAVDLSGATSASLSFNYDESGFDTADNETVLVQFAADGTNFTTIYTINGNSGAGPITLPLTGPFGASSAIRFVVSGVNGNNDLVGIDNIAVVKNVATTIPGSPGNNYTAVAYTEGGAAVAIASNPAISNGADTSIMSATIRLTNAQPQDVLTTVGTLPTGITASFGPAVAGQITMYLSGNASLAAYQTAIEAVRFANEGDDPNPTVAASPRTIQVSVNDGVSESLVATATVTVNAVNDPPSGGNDAIITNVASGIAFVVPEWVLLSNDVDPEGATLDVTGLSATGLTATLGTGSVSVTDTGTAGGSFAYTVSDGSAVDPTSPIASVNRINALNTTTYSENFGSTSYTDSDSNGAWTENWTETGDDNNSTSANGQIRIDTGQLRFDAGNTTGASDGAQIQRVINLAGATSATLSYSFSENIDAGETVLVQFAADGSNFQTVQTINSQSGSGNISNFALTGPFTANATLRFVVSSMNLDTDVASIDNISVSFTTPAPVNGTNNGEILVGDVNGSTFDAGGGNDLVLAGGGNDVIIWNANNNGDTDGRDFVDGGAGSDTFDLNTRAGTTESFRVYTVAAALSGPSAIAGLTAAALKPGTEIIITRTINGDPVSPASIIAELDNIEEIRIGTQTADPTNGSAGGGDTVAIFGDFSTTSLALNTITIDGNAGDDTVDISALTSAHRIVFRSNGGHDTIIGNLRPQDVIELPAGAVASDYTTTTDAGGVTTMTNGTHSIKFTASGGMPQVGDGDDDDDDDPSGNDDDDDNDPVGQRTGTPVADVLTGDDGDDSMVGFAGDDIITGNGGADSIAAGEGADFISGGDGRDVIFAGAGDDQVFAGGQADIVYGDAGADRIFGGGGNDLINAGSGDDVVFGGAGDDLIVAEAGDGNDVYFGDDNDGGAGIDTLDMSAVTANLTVNLGSGPLFNGTVSSSQTGNDTIWGIENVNTGSGSDTIIASNAVNVMNGGAGNDTFKFTSASAADGDTILSFEAGDRIDLTGIDANTGTAGDQSFTLVSGAFTAAGQLAVTFESRPDGDYTVIQGNINANADADFTIEVSGHQNLTNANLGL